MGVSKKEYFVRDLVIDDEYSEIDSETSVQDAAKKMKEVGVPDLVVIEKGSNKVIGVIADFDIVQDIVAEGKDPKTTKITEAMYTIEPVSLDTPVSEAFTRMQELEVSVVPVLKNNKLVGVCTIQDCWSYIPDRLPDEVGLIPVSNPNYAEFWFSSVCSLLAFVLGILLPLVGIFGYFTASHDAISSLFGAASIRGGAVSFYLFDARGTDFFYSLTNLIAKGGPIWGIIVVNSFIVLILGTIGIFSLIYSSLSDVRNIRTGRVVSLIIPSLVIIFMALEWIFFLIAFWVAGLIASVAVDGVGLVISIISMVLIFAAINREYIFRQSKLTAAEVSS